MSPFRRLSWIFLEHCWYQYWVRAVEVIAIVEVTSIRNSDETKKTPTTNGASNTRETRVKCRRTRQARECGTRAIDGFKVGLGIHRERSLPSGNITQSRSMTSMSHLLYFRVTWDHWVSKDTSRSVNNTNTRHVKRPDHPTGRPRPDQGQKCRSKFYPVQYRGLPRRESQGFQLAPAPPSWPLLMLTTPP